MAQEPLAHHIPLRAALPEVSGATATTLTLSATVSQLFVQPVSRAYCHQHYDVVRGYNLFEVDYTLHDLFARNSTIIEKQCIFTIRRLPRNAFLPINELLLLMVTRWFVVCAVMSPQEMCRSWRQSTGSAAPGCLWRLMPGRSSRALVAFDYISTRQLPPSCSRRPISSIRRCGH